MQLQIRNDLSQLDACLIVSAVDFTNLSHAFFSRKMELIAKGRKEARLHGLNYDDAYQNYWTSDEKRNELPESLIDALDCLRSLQASEDNFFRVIKPTNQQKNNGI